MLIFFLAIEVLAVLDSCETRMSPLARVSSASSDVNGMMATFSPKC